MANQTTEFKRTVSGTINSGMRSVFGGEGRRYFIIEHKDDSALHRRGEQQKMIVDEVFIGRDKKCQVLIDEQFGTVSREHAVIVRDGDRWKLIHRSSTNDTFVNGQRVMGEQYLQNGDEIQLSYNGPRLGFIIPQGDQSFVKSIGMTARLNLFRQQALRPYKTALTLLTILFCLAVAGLVTGLVLTKKENSGLSDRLTALQKQFGEIDTVTVVKYVTPGTGTKHPGSTPTGPTPSELQAFEPYVYFVKMTHLTATAPKGTAAYDVLGDGVFTISLEGNGIPKATGFITSDGHFITARHVVEPWAYYASGDISDPYTKLNVLKYLDAVIDATIVVESKTGDRRTFHYRDFDVKRSSDVTREVYFWDEDGEKYTYEATFAGGDDYAYKKINVNSNLVMNPSLAKSLPAGAKLETLGFPYGQGGQANHIRPQYTFATTSNSGLLNNVIPVTGASFESGNSGGPVFYKDGKNYYVVGIVSNRYGRSSGEVVPVSAISF